MKHRILKFKSSIVKTILISTLLISCSKSDDDNVNQTDPILGTWQVYGFIDLDDPNNPKESTFSECDQKSTLTFKEGGLYERTNYANLLDEGCQPDPSYEFYNGTWQNKGSDIYDIYWEDNRGGSDYEAGDDISKQVRFKEDGNRMEYFYVGDESETYVFKRVN